MKNTFRVLGAITLLAVIGFSMAACDNGTTSGADTGGNKFTGTWKNQWDEQGKTCVIEYKFYNDSCFIGRDFEGGKRIGFNFGTYTFTDTAITFTSNSGTWTENYTMSGKTLNLEQDAAKHWAGTFTKDNVSYGLFTLTGIPSEFEGKYAICRTYTNQLGQIWGIPDAGNNGMYLTKISNGKVVLPLNVNNSWDEYKGNDTMYVYFWVFGNAVVKNVYQDSSILDNALFSQTKFTNGSAVKSWKDSAMHGLEKKGTITITDIPSQYNGKYAIFYARSPYDVWGIQGNDSNGNMVLTKISDGKVSIPVTTYNSGNDTFKDASLYVYESSTIYNLDVPRLDIANFASIKFADGNAAISWNEKK